MLASSKQKYSKTLAFPKAYYECIINLPQSVELFCAYDDRPAFMVKYFDSFVISEIQSMFAQMPNEYHALKQEKSRHETLLEKNGTNEALCKKLVTAGYLSSYDIKKEKNILFTGDLEKYVARVKAKR